MVKQTRKRSNRLYRKSRKSHRKLKKGGMPPPIRDAATYSYPPYFPNKGPEGKDYWPVKFQGPNISDLNIEKYKDYPLAEDVIVDVREQAGLQVGGYVYDPRMLKKLQSKNKSIRHHKFLKQNRPFPLMVKKINKK